MRKLNYFKPMLWVMPLVAVTACASWSDNAVSRSGTPSFGTVDRDQNDRISRQEASGYPSLSGIFDRLDADADGELSREEYH